MKVFWRSYNLTRLPHTGQRSKEVLPDTPSAFCPTPSPFNHRRTPSQARAKDHQQDEIPPRNLARRNRFVERDADGRSRSVAVAVEVHKDLIRRHAEALADRVNDPAVGLVRD